MTELSICPQRIVDTIVTAAPLPAHIILACLRAPDDVLSGLCAHPGVDWTRVAREAELHRVGLLALDRLQRSDVVAAGCVPPAVLARLREQRREHVAQAIKLDAVLDGVLEACAAAGIPVVLKGLALGRLYPSPWLRPRSDLDLLIDPLHWAAVDRLLTGMGYSLDTDIIPRLDAMEQARQLPPTQFDAYDPPGRMLEHLLLSGNVRPKMAALGHRLLPTEEWLRYNGPERVALYRLRLLVARLSAASG